MLSKVAWAYYASAGDDEISKSFSRRKGHCSDTDIPSQGG